MRPLPDQVHQFLLPYPPDVRELLLEVRDRLVAILPPCVETLWDATNVVGFGYGFTERNADTFLHLPAYTKYINLGFNFGAHLDDPEGRLKGTGARIRHLRITKVEEFEDPYVHRLIEQAVAMAPHAGTNVAERSVVRVMEGPKRRPGNSRAVK